MHPLSALPTTEFNSDEAELAAAHQKISNLETALITARRIGTATGIVMANYKVTNDEAFDLLVMASMKSNRKLRDIAQDVIDTGDLRWSEVE